MGWATVLTNWAVNQKIKAAALNNLNAGIQELATGSMMEVNSAAIQSIPNNIATIVTMPTVATKQVGTGMTATANGITIVTAGDFLVSGYINFATNATGMRFATVTNGAALGVVSSQTAAAPTPYGTAFAFVFDMSFNAGDTISLVVQQISGAALNTAPPCRLRVRRLN